MAGKGLINCARSLQGRNKDLRGYRNQHLAGKWKCSFLKIATSVKTITSRGGERVAGLASPGLKSCPQQRAKLCPGSSCSKVV